SSTAGLAYITDEHFPDSVLAVRRGTSQYGLRGHLTGYTKKGNSKNRTNAGLFCEVQAAAMGLNAPFRNRQAQPRASGFARTCLIDSVEAFEYPFAMLS